MNAYRTKTGRAALALAAALLAGGSAASCGSSSDDPGPVEPPPPAPLPEVAAQTGAQRLSLAQYRNSVAYALGDDVVVPAALEPDVSQNGFVSIGGSFSTVSARGIEQYEKAAYAIAKQALAPERRARLVSCAPAGVRDDACAGSTLGAVGRKLWRRPLAADEVSRLVEVSGQAATTLGDFAAGLEFGLAALLQSPSFLFRSAAGEDDPARPGLRRYTSIEMASRLSFFLWNTSPDEELLGAAEAGALVEEAGLRQQVARLLEAPAARQGARQFFSEYLGLGALDQLSKDPTLFTYYSPEVGPAAREETLRLFEHLAFDADADYREIFTTRTTFVNPKLASMYAIQAPSLDGFARAELPEDSPRRGLLGHTSVLALQAHPVSSSATLRGRFIRTKLLCQGVPDPPVNVNTALPEPTPQLATLRQRITSHLEVESCATCHLLMDPLGLGLEQFDGLGRFRRLENGAEIDPSGDVDGVRFDDARGLGQALHDHPDIGQCFARNLHRYATSFVETREDNGTIDALSAHFAASGYRVRSLLMTIALAPSFRLAREPR